LAAAALAAAALVAVPGVAAAHPNEKGETPLLGETVDARWIERLAGEPGGDPEQPVGPGIANLRLVGNSDKDGVTNSDLAFWGNYAYAGNYGGLRILDIRRNQPRVVADVACNGPQNDVSVWDVGDRRLLFQSIDTPQDREDCASRNADLQQTAEGTQYRVGYEGVRVFDITNPASPRFLDMIQTACGSHTHTLVPDARNRRVFLYVSSYPLGTANTPEGVEGPNADFRACRTPHKKISVIEVPYSFRAPGDATVVEHELGDETELNNGFQACHDIQVFLPRRIAVGACAGDAQIWDVSDRANPDLEGATHIYSPSDARSPGGNETEFDDYFEFIHSSVVSWDGETVAIMDETGGGGTAECDGDVSNDGFYYYYDLVDPGDPAPPLKGRYTIPRPQGEEICVSHNSTVVPVRGRDIMTIAYYQGGVTVVDFTDVSLDNQPREIAYADVEDEIGASDEWSSYWYNGRIFSNSGLNRRGPAGASTNTNNRGLDVWRPAGELSALVAGAKRWRYSNPQTQESHQRP
jgi:hypothetical protein